MADGGLLANSVSFGTGRSCFPLLVSWWSFVLPFSLTLKNGSLALGEFFSQQICQVYLLSQYCAVERYPAVGSQLSYVVCQDISVFLSNEEMNIQD